MNFHFTYDTTATINDTIEAFYKDTIDRSTYLDSKDVKGSFCYALQIQEFVDIETHSNSFILIDKIISPIDKTTSPQSYRKLFNCDGREINFPLKDFSDQYEYKNLIFDYCYEAYGDI